jgi:hypothetical protein
MQIVSRCREQARLVYDGAVFEIIMVFPQFSDLRRSRVLCPAWGIVPKLCDTFAEIAERRMSHLERLTSS